MIFNSDLINDLAKRRVALFLGAGVSAGVETVSGKRVSTWESFLKEVSKKVVNKKERTFILQKIKENDYLLACELLKENLKHEWDEILRKEYAQLQKENRITPLQASLLSLKQRITITTNFDKFYENAWVHVNKDATHHPKIESKISEKTFHAFRDDSTYIFKIHGTIDDLDSLIFSKKEYVEKAFSSWAYTKFIDTILTTHTVLFIGFSLADPVISYILEMYAKNHPNARPHYAFFAGEFPENYINTMKVLRRLYIIPYNAQNGHKMLSDLLNSLSVEADKKRKELNVLRQQDFTPDKNDTPENKTPVKKNKTAKNNRKATQRAPR